MTPYADIVAAARAEERELVRVERRGDRALVTLADPGKLNILSAALTVQLAEALRALGAEEEVRSIVLTGEDPGFSAGGDLRMMEDAVERIADPADGSGSTTAWRWIRGQFGAVARLIHHTDKAFIAALNGPAAGVGLAFAFTCDLVVASERAVIVPAFGRLGLLPEVGTSWALTRRLGYQRAFALYVEGRHLDAREALELGLVTEVVPHAELLGAADRWCERVAAAPDHAVAMTKPLLRACADLPWEDSLRMEEFAEPNCFTTAAFARSVRDLLARV